MSTRFPGTARSRGFALVAAVFLLVVIAALGAFAVRVHLSAQGNSDLELAGVHADAALQTGIQYAAARLLATGDCNALTNPLPLPQNFSVDFGGCGQAQIPDAPVVFSVVVTATRGLYGSPDFVSRQRPVRITTP